MILVFDIFGVVVTAEGLNRPLLNLLQTQRQSGTKVYFASNMDGQQKNQYWLLLQPYGEAIYCSGELGVAKPTPGFYHQVEKALQPNGKPILFFDDSAANVTAAQACGWQAYLYKTVEDAQLHITESSQL